MPFQPAVRVTSSRSPLSQRLLRPHRQQVAGSASQLPKTAQTFPKSGAPDRGRCKRPCSAGAAWAKVKALPDMQARAGAFMSETPGSRDGMLGCCMEVPIASSSVHLVQPLLRLPARLLLMPARVSRRASHWPAQPGTAGRRQLGSSCLVAHRGQTLMSMMVMAGGGSCGWLLGRRDTQVPPALWHTAGTHKACTKRKSSYCQGKVSGLSSTGAWVHRR